MALPALFTVRALLPVVPAGWISSPGAQVVRAAVLENLAQSSALKPADGHSPELPALAAPSGEGGGQDIVGDALAADGLSIIPFYTLSFQVLGQNYINSPGFGV